MKKTKLKKRIDKSSVQTPFIYDIKKLENKIKEWQS